MDLQQLPWSVIVNGAIQLTGLGVILFMGIRAYRELVRLHRVTGALIAQESEKMRAYLDQVFGPHTRR